MRREYVVTVESESERRLLEKEARLYGRYLVDREPSQEIVERFVEACGELGVTATLESSAAGSGAESAQQGAGGYVTATAESGVGGLRGAHPGSRVAHPGSSAGMTRFCLAHPWSLPFLDAGCALIRPEAALRRKIYIMAAVLEASTQYTDKFLPADLPGPAFLVRVAVNGMIACVKAAIGVPLLIFVEGRRRD